MDKTKFSGIFPALVTPFYQDGDINYDSLKEIMDYNINKGVTGFYVCGSTSEVFRLTEKERFELYKKCAEFANKRCTLIGHVGAFSTEQTIQYARYCEELGYDAVSAVTPFYFGYASEDIENYYIEIANSVSIPVFLYHIPSRSGTSLSFESLQRLFSYDNIVGMKFTSNDYYTFERVRKAFPNKVLLNGFDEMLICGLATGADGAIGSTYNLCADIFIKIYKLCKSNDFAQALKYQNQANDIVSDLISQKDGIATLKFAIKELLGIDCGETRKPGGRTNKDWEEQFLNKYKNLG